MSNTDKKQSTSKASAEKLLLLKIYAVQHDRHIVDIIDEAFDLFIAKHHVTF